MQVAEISRYNQRNGKACTRFVDLFLGIIVIQGHCRLRNGLGYIGTYVLKYQYILLCHRVAWYTNSYVLEPNFSTLEDM